MTIKWKGLDLQMEGAHQELSSMNETLPPKRPILDTFQNIRDKGKILRLSEVKKQFTHTEMGAKTINILKGESLW